MPTAWTVLLGSRHDGTNDNSKSREKTLRLQDAAKLRKQLSWQLGTHRTDVKKYRAIAGETIDGVERGRTCSLLRYRKDLRLKYRRRKTEDVYADVVQDNHLKCRQLDKLDYEKKKKLKRCFELQLEHAELSDEYARSQAMPRLNGTQQRLITRYQRSMAKQNAARAIRSTYVFMLDIMKKDAIRHETLLNALEKDRSFQCKVILKATILGQLAAEESDDVRSKYRQMTRQVWNSMKDRDLALISVRERVEDLWAYARSLMRAESDVFLNRKTRPTTISTLILERQITSLEETFDRVKESLLVRSYRELFSRLEEQARQRTRLVAQFDRNVKERDSLLAEKNHSLSILSNAQHSLVASREQYNAHKCMLLGRIALQRKRNFEHQDSRKIRGRLLMNVRAALQSMAAMLTCVKRGDKGAKRLTKELEKKATKELDEKDDTEEPEQRATKADLLTIEKMESEGLALLATVGRKVGALFGMSNFELDRDRDDRARDLYRTYVSNYCSTLKFKQTESESAGFFVEHEVIDSLVPTRAEIKLRSKQMIETRTKM